MVILLHIAVSYQWDFIPYTPHIPPFSAHFGALEAKSYIHSNMNNPLIGCYEIG